jgi:hypothetical protein
MQDFLVMEFASAFVIAKQALSMIANHIQLLSAVFAETIRTGLIIFPTCAISSRKNSASTFGSDAESRCNIAIRESSIAIGNDKVFLFGFCHLNSFPLNLIFFGTP